MVTGCNSSATSLISRGAPHAPAQLTGIAIVGVLDLKLNLQDAREKRVRNLCKTQACLSNTITCNSPCANLLDEPETMRPKFLFEIPKIVNAGYVARMNKALAHLVKLHGGHTTPVNAATAKEGF